MEAPMPEPYEATCGFGDQTMKWTRVFASQMFFAHGCGFLLLCLEMYLKDLIRV